MVGVAVVDEPDWLLAVDALGEVSMEEGIVHIHLVYWPLACRCNGEDGADGGRLDHWREGLVEVYTGPLREPTDHPPCLIALQAPVGLELVTKKPLAGDDVGSRRSRNKTPCPVLHQRRILNLHCS